MRGEEGVKDSRGSTNSTKLEEAFLFSKTERERCVSEVVNMASWSLTRLLEISDRCLQHFRGKDTI